MTSNSDFKHRVRARMDDTGENYMTAARALREPGDVTTNPVAPEGPQPATGLGDDGHDDEALDRGSTDDDYDRLPAEWACPECGAENKYYCNCRHSNQECDECGATGNYGCNC